MGDGDGFLSAEEVTSYAKDVMGLTLTDEVTKEITGFIKDLDTDGDGKISKEEFTSASLLQLKSKLSIRDAPGGAEFADADKDGDGFFSAEEVTAFATDVMGLTLTDEVTKEFTRIWIPTAMARSAK